MADWCSQVKSPYSYLVDMPNGARRHLHANKLRKLITHVDTIGVIHEKDSEFGDIHVISTESESDELPSKCIDPAVIAHLDHDQQKQLLQLLDEFAICFHNQPGLYTGVEQEIITGPAFKPRLSRAYRVPDVLKAEIEKQVDDLLKMGFIRESDSKMTSGVVCVLRPNESVRLAIDY